MIVSRRPLPLSVRRALTLVTLALITACQEITEPAPRALPPKAAVTPPVAQQAPLLAYIARVNSGSVAVVEPATPSTVATVPVGSGPAGVAITPDGTEAWVANSNETTVSVIETATNTVVSTVTVGQRPFGIAISPDGSTAYVANFQGHSVTVVDVATRSVGATIPVGVNPHFLTVSPDGAHVYVANSGSGTVSVLAASTNTVASTFSSRGVAPLDIAIRPDGSEMFVSNTGSDHVAVFSLPSNAWLGNILVGGEPRSLVVTPDGSTAYTANATDNTVSVIDLASRVVTATIPVAANFPRDIAVSSDGSLVIVPGAAFPGMVSVIDTNSNTETRSFTVGTNLFGVALTSQSQIFEVGLDIRPGSDSNVINCTNERGVIPVALLTTPDFDATTVDHTTVTFEGAAETHVDRKSGLPRRHEEDVDSDGDLDLVFHFRFGDTGLDCTSTEGALIGETFDGTPIEGSDAITMVGQ